MRKPKPKSLKPNIKPVGIKIRSRGCMFDIGKDPDAGLIERHPGTPEETLETAGCTGQCPTYPGAPKTKSGYPDCTKCPQFREYENV